MSVYPRKLLKLGVHFPLCHFMVVDRYAIILNHAITLISLKSHDHQSRLIETQHVEPN